MKILGLCCSQRLGGNSEFLLKEVLQGAQQEGAETELYSVSGKEYSALRWLSFLHENR